MGLICLTFSGGCEISSNPRNEDWSWPSYILEGPAPDHNRGPDSGPLMQPGEGAAAVATAVCPLCGLRWHTQEMADWCCDADRVAPPPREAVEWLAQLADQHGLVADEALDALGFCDVAGLGEIGRMVAAQYTRYELAAKKWTGSGEEDYDGEGA